MPGLGVETVAAVVASAVTVGLRIRQTGVPGVENHAASVWKVTVLRVCVGVTKIEGQVVSGQPVAFDLQT